MKIILDNDTLIESDERSIEIAYNNFLEMTLNYGNPTVNRIAIKTMDAIQESLQNKKDSIILNTDEILEKEDLMDALAVLNIIKCEYTNEFVLIVIENAIKFIYLNLFIKDENTGMQS